MAEYPLGLSFDDVLLLPCLSTILPGDADVSSRLVSSFPLRLPIDPFFPDGYGDGIGNGDCHGA